MGIVGRPGRDEGWGSESGAHSASNRGNPEDEQEAPRRAAPSSLQSETQPKRPPRLKAKFSDTEIRGSMYDETIRRGSLPATRPNPRRSTGSSRYRDGSNSLPERLKARHSEGSVLFIEKMRFFHMYIHVSTCSWV